MNKCDVCVHMCLDKNGCKCDIVDFEDLRRSECKYAICTLNEILNNKYISEEIYNE